MRHDAIGFFWQDEPVVKVKKEKPKRIPPEPTWERPDYLPNLEEARNFKINLFNDDDLIRSWISQERLIFDIECYVNYFLIAFIGEQCRRVIFFEFEDNEYLNNQDWAKLSWIIKNFCVIGFNSYNYDIPMTALALNQLTTAQLKQATDWIIMGDENGPLRPSDVLRRFKTRMLQGVNHIDLIEVAPLDASLKQYSGRLHAPRMQDLPFKPSTELSCEQKMIVRWYCVNDLTNTDLLYKKLLPQIQLRETMSMQYKTDLRSKSDAQIAEAVIIEELQRITGQRPRKPNIDWDTQYKYYPPAYLKYQTPEMQWVLSLVSRVGFRLNAAGAVAMPPELDLDIPLFGGVYRMGIGGLHSSEKKTVHKSDKDVILLDRDVTSYYPSIILNQNLYPTQLGPQFLHVYRNIVDTRIGAKRSGDKVTADALKITINGSFGKLGSPYSVLYSPQLMLQVTITGQLSLLLLIERLELAGVPVVSANTDGVVIKCPRSRRADMEAIVKQWESDTEFETEETEYAALYSRDVNNYIAVKPDGKTKRKGAYSEESLSKNPVNTICVDAAIEMITKGVPVDTTIRACKDIRKFLTVRRVRGGAWKDGVFLGKDIRWYYADGEAGEIVYALSGNKVPKSEGAQPLMTLPDEFPSNVDYAKYEEETWDILRDLAFIS
jgi:DNA polymerase elongation subunit (family B)